MYIVHIRGIDREWQKYPTPELKKQKIGNAFPALESNLFFSCIDLWYLEHLSHSLLTLYFPDYLLFLPENSVNIFLCTKLLVFTYKTSNRNLPNKAKSALQCHPCP